MVSKLPKNPEGTILHVVTGKIQKQLRRKVVDNMLFILSFLMYHFFVGSSLTCVSHELSGSDISL